MVNNKKIQEGISGAYPDMTLGQEMLSGLFMLSVLVLPAILEYFRVQLTKPQIKDIAKKIVASVKADNSKDTLKRKTVRAINIMLQKMSSKNVSVENELNKLIPDNLEKKNEEELTTDVKQRMLGIKGIKLPPGFRI